MLAHGFARVRCESCKDDLLVAFSLQVTPHFHSRVPLGVLLGGLLAVGCGGPSADEGALLEERLVTGTAGAAVPKPRPDRLAAGSYHTLFLPGDGTVLAWGKNTDGQLARPETTYWSTTPLPVPGFFGVSVTAVAAAGYTSLALTSTGTVYSWGGNTHGLLGLGTEYEKVRSPVRIPSLSGVVALFASSTHCLALLSDGTVRAWGRNYEGAVGDGTRIDRLTPVPVPGLTGVVAIETGDWSSLALRSDGTVRAWGEGWSLGAGTNGPLYAPVTLQNLSGIVALETGAMHSVALGSNGTLRAWGNNLWGALGDGTESSSNVPVPVVGF